MAKATEPSFISHSSVHIKVLQALQAIVFYQLIAKLHP
jgi:hypothetical protein